MSKENSVKISLRNRKSREYPLKPKSMSELSISYAWTLYKNNRFLLYDSGLNSNERRMIFALNYITNANDWFYDGNFFLSPEHFLQLYVIRVKK